MLSAHKQMVRLPPSLTLQYPYALDLLFLPWAFDEAPGVVEFRLRRYMCLSDFLVVLCLQDLCKVVR